MFKAWNLEVVSIKGMSASSPVSSCSALSTIKHHMLYRRAIHVVDPCHRKKYSSRCQTQVWHDVLEGWHRKKSHPNTFPHTAPWEFPRGPRNWTEGWSGVKNLTGTFWSLLLKLLKILNPKTDVIMCMYIYEQPPLFGKERNSLWMETFFFQIHLAYGNEVGGNWKTRY